MIFCLPSCIMEERIPTIIEKERTVPDMKFEAVYHIASDNYCYMNNFNELIVNLKTGYDVEEVYIHYSICACAQTG